MKFAPFASGLLLLAGCATLPAAPLDPADPLAPALLRAEAALRALAADLAAGAEVPRADAALAEVEGARVALAVRQVTTGARVEDLALGATLLACRQAALRLAGAPRATGARPSARALLLTCLAPLSTVTAGLAAGPVPADQRL